MKIAQPRSEGFSAVELLITLFIGATFLLAGYQLFIYSLRANADARLMAQVSNEAYSHLREHAAEAAGSECSAGTPANNQLLTIDDVNNPRLTVTITCPYGSGAGSDAVSRVTARITYAAPTGTQEVAHAIFVR